MSHNITIEGGTSVRLPTAGKYCDRDIVITAEGGKEDLEAVLAEQEALIDELKAVLRDKASGGGSNKNYAKFTVKPTSTTSLTIPNPLGGIAKFFAIRRLSDTTPSSQKYYKFVGSYDPPLGAGEFASDSNTVRYVLRRTDGSINNAYFKITEGEIQVYRYNTANTWDTTSEYEVEIIGDLTENAGGEVVEPVIEPLAITENGTYTAPDGVDGYSPVTVNVPIPDGYIVPSGELEVTENGTHDVTQYASVNVNVEASGGGTDTRLKDLLENTITEIDDDSITTIRSYGLCGVSNLVRINLPNVKSVGSYACQDCTSLVSVDLPNFSAAVATFTYNGCTALSKFNAPNATGANNYSFQDCSSLEKVEFGHATTIGSYSFRRAAKLTALIIRNTTTKLTNLTSTNAFTDCPIENGTGYIYFYRQYVEDYKVKTNWSTYAAQIRAIEDYPEITGG